MAIIISQDRPGSSNSLTLSWLLIVIKELDTDKFYEDPTMLIRKFDEAK